MGTATATATATMTTMTTTTKTKVINRDHDCTARNGAVGNQSPSNNATAVCTHLDDGREEGYDGGEKQLVEHIQQLEPPVLARVRVVEETNLYTDGRHVHDLSGEQQREREREREGGREEHMRGARE